jgi:phage I-like protein
MKLLAAVALVMSSSAHAGYLQVCPAGQAPQDGWPTAASSW